MKQQLLSDIAGRLSSIGIPSQTSSETDIAINVEFLDANWSTGNKKINYESFILINEEDRTVYMYELTKELGQGLSWGSSSESTFQSGTTLYRKVKSIQYGPDGKAYEYSLDLGSIPKAVKAAAKEQGWKFKTVLKKSKAMYPSAITAPADTQTTKVSTIWIILAVVVILIIIWWLIVPQ